MSREDVHQAFALPNVAHESGRLLKYRQRLRNESAPVEHHTAVITRLGKRFDEVFPDKTHPAQKENCFQNVRLRFPYKIHPKVQPCAVPIEISDAVTPSAEGKNCFHFFWSGRVPIANRSAATIPNFRDTFR